MLSYRDSLQSLLRVLKHGSMVIAVAAVSLAAGPAQTGWAQAASAATPGPDVLTLANGDHLAGTLVSEANGTVTFHSDGAGDLTLTWDKIKSIQTAGKFAVIQQGQRVSRKTADSEVLQGVVAAEEGKVRVNTGAEGAPKEITQPDTQYMIEAGLYTKKVHSNPGWSHGWIGALSAGVADVEATQNSRTFTGEANFVRAIPGVSWLDPRNRTTANFAAAYGSLSQPGAATTKTAEQELDMKGDIHYERQHFGFTPGVVPPVKTPDKNLIGANIGDTYAAKLAHGMVFNQGLVVTPAFNTPSAYSALATAGLTFPVYKRLGFNLSALDDFLNDPAFGSKKNSFQFSAGLTYTLK